MGSPVSAVVVNLYMEIFEDGAQKLNWYVDGIFGILRKGTAEELRKHLNGIKPKIKFTANLEEDGTLPCLDTLARRREDGGLDITVYTKPTHTGTSTLNPTTQPK